MHYEEIPEYGLPESLSSSLNYFVSLIYSAEKNYFQYDRYSDDISPEFCWHRTSGEILEEIINECDKKGYFFDHEKDIVTRYKSKHVGDANYYSLRAWQYACSLWHQGPLHDELCKIIDDPVQTGAFWYPRNGYMGWHTNEDSLGYRIYCSYVPEDNKSFFRFRVPGTDKIVTSWEKKGWTFRYFEVGKNEEDRLWHCIYSNTDRISLGFAPKSEDSFVLNLLLGHHTLRNEWHLQDFPALEEPNYYMIPNCDLFPLIKDRDPELIDFSDICHKPMLEPDYTEHSRRYKACNEKIPGVVVEGMANPENLRYRMIDGKHRIHKLKNLNVDKSQFYVLRYEEVKPLIRPLY